MENITILLDRLAHGDKTSEGELFDVVYKELHKLAARQMSRERRDHSLQPTALVNEAYLRLVGDRGLSWDSRAHFYNAAAQTMRRILIDHARAAKSKKRHGGVKVELGPDAAFTNTSSEEMLAIDEALTRLRGLDARAAQVVELRFFTGLSVEEVAGALKVSEKTVKRDWEFSRAWLENQLRSVEPVAE